MTCKITSEKGAVLVVSLWILAILTVLAVGFAYRMSIELKLTGYQIARLKALHLAKAGIIRALSTLHSEENRGFAALSQRWNNNPEEFDGMKLGEGLFTVSHASADSDSGDTSYGAMDEERKLNVNFASREMLESLPGMSQEVAAAVLDWRDADNKPRPNGAEDSYYQSLPTPYPCKNGDFELLEELLLVKGMTPPLLNLIRDWITVYGDGRVNINTCHLQILIALGLQESTAQKIISFRSGIDNLEGTQDDNVFENLETIVETLSDHQDLTSGELKELADVLARDILCVRSSYFRIESVGSLIDDKVTRKICAVVRAEKDKPVHVVYWHEE